jgi:hypothetical protein
MADYGPETAKVIAGGFGSVVGVYLRNPKSLVRVFAHVLIGMGFAWFFADAAAGWFSLPVEPIAAAIGLLGKALAETVLRGIEKADVSGWLQKGKE